MTLQQAIQEATGKLIRSGVTNARLDAEVLLSHILHRDRAWLFTHASEALDRDSESILQALVERRVRREPLQYIIGRQEFWGLEFRVTPEVLIPRPETELVVESAVNALRGLPQPAIIDLCTGSGCIAVSLAGEFPSATIDATDASGPALAIAAENARQHGVDDRIRFHAGDLFEPLGQRIAQFSVDLITANPPYIPAADMLSLQPEVRDYEPALALVGGDAGTEVHERIIRDAPAWLKQGGFLIMEMGIGQAEALGRIVRAAGAYGEPEILKDLAGIDRVIIARKREL